MRRLLGFALLLTLLGTTGPAAPAAARKGPSRQQLAIKLFLKAEQRVERDRACRTVEAPGRPTFTNAAPSSDLLSTLGILRRPEADDERLLHNSLEFPFGKDIYRRHIRIARSAGGREVFVYAARDSDFTRPRPERCRVAVRRRLERLLRDRPAAVRRLARRIAHGIQRVERRQNAARPREGVFLFERLPGDGGLGSGSGGSNARTIRRSGMFQSSSEGRRDRRARVDGLLPDGVATVTATYGRRGVPGFRGKRRRYAQAIKRTVPVQDNVISFEVPRSSEDALFPVRWVWRSADGRIVRVTRSPFAQRASGRG